MKQPFNIWMMTCVGLLFSVSTGWAAVGCDLNDPDRDVARLFPGSSGYKTVYVSIDKKGGEPLLKEIEARLGDKFQGLFETADVPYTIYEIYRDVEKIGYIHGVNQKGQFGGIQVFLTLDLSGVVKNLYFQKLTSKAATALRSPEFGRQFEGLSLTDFYPYITDPGYGRRVGGYEPDLEALIPAFGGYPMVLNFGLASETTAHGVNRLSSVLASVTAHSILILEGTNDIWEGISLETTLFNLNQMIEKSRSSGLRPIIATLTPDERDGVKDLKQIPETYNPAIRQLARDQKIPLADLYAAVIDNWANLVSEDGLHPNAEGYQTIAQKWFMAMLQRRGP